MLIVCATQALQLRRAQSARPRRVLRRNAMPELPWAADAGVKQSNAQTRRAWRRARRGEVLRFGGPALATVLADPLMSVVDALCCGRSCPTLELASLGPALAVFNFFNYFFFFLNAATTVRVTKALANGDDAGASRELGQTVAVAALSGLAVGAAVLKSATSLAAATGCRPELVPVAAAYLRVRVLAQPVVLASMVAQAGLLAQRDARTPFDAVLLACACNVAGDLLLVPRLGAVGAAWATLASQVAALSALLLLSKRRKRLSALPRLPKLKNLAPLVAAARPLFCFEVGLCVCYGAVQVLGSRFSVASTAAFQALWTPAAFIFFMSYPLKQAAAVFLPALATEPDQTVGARPKSKEFVKVLCGLGVQVGLVMGALTWACAQSPAIFTPDASLHATIRSFAVPAAAASLILPFSQLAEGALLGAGDLGFLGASQIPNVAVTLGGGAVLLRGDAGVRGAYVVLLAFYGSRVVQGLLRVFVARPPWRNWRAYALAPAALAAPTDLGEREIPFDGAL